MSSTPDGIGQSSPFYGSEHSSEESVFTFIYLGPYGTETVEQQQKFRSPEAFPGLGACASHWEGLVSSSILV